MKTVSSIAAASSVTALSTLGFAVVRREQQQHLPPPPTTSEEMSTTATFTAHHPYTHENRLLPTFDGYFSSSPANTPSPRPATTPDNGRTLASSSGSKRGPQKRRSSLTPGAAVGVLMERSRRGADDSSGGGQSRTSSGSRQPASTPTTWLRRLSSGMSNSRDSSRASSRPSSAAYTNGSVAGSTMPFLPDNTPPTLPRNRLVKRTASLHSAKSSPLGSRLPVPTLRRPATSHQRSVTLQERFSNSDSSDAGATHTRDAQWQHYFTPRVPAGETVMSTRRRSTGIPNPIKRVYPDRRYTPMLVSAKEMKAPAAVEVDEQDSDYEEEGFGDAGPPLEPSTASSPFPPKTTHFEASPPPRRSFSIGDMLHPQPSRQRPSSSRGKPRTLLKARPRVLSAPQAPMGNSFSNISGHESERPAKRRDLTDPKQSQRSIYTSSSNDASLIAQKPQEIDLDLGIEPSTLQFTPDHSLFVQPLSPEPTPPPQDQQRLPSASHSTSSTRPQRLSAARSEIASTIGSDFEYRSLGDYSTDYQSDNAYDSIQTRTTRSSSGRRGPHIETIFDDSPPAFSSGRSTKLRDFLGDGQFAGGERFRHSTIEEEGSIVSTPVRSVRNRSVTSTPSARPGASQAFSSSPPTMRAMPDPDDIDWDISDDEKTDSGLGMREIFDPHAMAATPEMPLPFRFGPSLRPPNSRSANSTPQRNGASPLEKTNLFDWSEQQPSPSHPNRSPPRPRTVHGKKDQDSRGSRPAARRPASGMHARSHSVPVVPDLDGKRHDVVANKFGTWGQGSKVVTEDWNEDFDFDEPHLPVAAKGGVDEKRIDSGHDMFVPKSIREQQHNVVANISLLREWGLLIEELKELRIRAKELELMNGHHAQSWREVDAMIELADQESEEHTLEPRHSPPSSPGFDYSAFEDTSMVGKGSKRHSQSPSVKTPEAEQFNERGISPSPQPGWAETPRATPVNRPRKDSELVAQSVIAALHSKRNTTDLSELRSPHTKKVPFDTATLRHIVPYVNGLKRKVKDALREAEGLYSSPHRRTSPASPWSEEGGQKALPLRNVFHESSGNDLFGRRQSRRAQAATDNDENDQGNE